MILLKNLAVGTLLFLPLLTCAQSFTGSVLDSQTGLHLPYASIGVRGKSIGGITDIDGHFLIDVTKAQPTDSIIVSYLGYQSKTLLKRDIGQAACEIKLVAKPFQLSEVVAVGKREIITIGNTKASGHFTGWGDYSASKGRLRGSVVETDELPLKLAKFKLRLDACEFDSVRFRLHILPLPADHSGNIKTELLQHNIFFTAHKDQKWVSVDLAPYNLVIDQNIIVAVEWVDSWVKTGGSHLLTLSTSRKDGYTYTRETPEEPFQMIRYQFSPTMYFETYKAGPSQP